MVTINIDQLNKFIPLASFLFACGGAAFAYVKFMEEGRRQREAIADQLYQNYLQQALKYPGLSWPENQVPSDERYPWLVAIMCNALAAQIKCNRSPDMEAAIAADLLNHKKYFESKVFLTEGGWALYPPQLKRLYDKAGKPE